MTEHDLLTDVRWRRSSFSGGGGTGGGDCVECASLTDGRVAIRDSKAPTAGVLFFSRATMDACLRAVNADNFRKR